jgi:hypothetical protein
VSTATSNNSSHGFKLYVSVFKALLLYSLLHRSAIYCTASALRWTRPIAYSVYNRNKWINIFKKQNNGTMKFTPVLLIILTASVTPLFSHPSIHPWWTHQSLLCISVSARPGLRTIDVWLVSVGSSSKCSWCKCFPPFYYFEMQSCQQQATPRFLFCVA